ncbi:3-dehydroshikimate dehydratase-like protein [Coniella lustricola]|uniref:3-dehydroshikimate dehydratase-like protein n=1 Tax=Coniella lustricola TaxID=2025994 RepID=A0A2T3AGE3_9PEZI|nr:3-dehydroshikimate dehydratase-like protein [Coniella lustricola]
MACKLGITSMSLGWPHAGHSFAPKLDILEQQGYQGIELFEADLLDHAKRLDPECDAEPSHQAQLRAAHDIRRLCASKNISIICLQPFACYEGLVDRQEHSARIEKLHRWMELATALETDLIQVPSSYLPPAQASGDMDLIVSDLQEISDLGAAHNPPLRFVYEALSFGTRINTWEQSWEVVQKVDRPNFGLCLDSFNIAGRIYADPASPSGKNPDADEVVAASMERIVERVELSKLFYVQIVDAQRLAEPLVEGHRFYAADQTPRMSWSRNCRLFYGETDRGAYLPVKQIADTIFNRLGFRGWVSLEIFNQRMSDKDPKVPQELAERGAVSWAKLVEDMHLVTKSPSTHDPSRFLNLST